MIWLASKSKTIFIREPLNNASNKNDAGDGEIPCAEAVLSCFTFLISTWVIHQSAVAKIVELMKVEPPPPPNLDCTSMWKPGNRLAKLDISVITDIMGTRDDTSNTGCSNDTWCRKPEIMEDMYFLSVVGKACHTKHSCLHRHKKINSILAKPSTICA